MVFIGLLLLFLVAGSGPSDNSAQAASDNTTKVNKYQDIIADLVKVNRHLLEQNKLLHEKTLALLNSTGLDYADFETSYQATLASIESRLGAAY